MRSWLIAHMGIRYAFSCALIFGIYLLFAWMFQVEWILINLDELLLGAIYVLMVGALLEYGSNLVGLAVEGLLIYVVINLFEDYGEYLVGLKGWIIVAFVIGTVLGIRDGYYASHNIDDIISRRTRFRLSKVNLLDFSFAYVLDRTFAGAASATATFIIIFALLSPNFKTFVTTEFKDVPQVEEIQTQTKHKDKSEKRISTKTKSPKKRNNGKDCLPMNPEKFTYIYNDAKSINSLVTKSETVKINGQKYTFSIGPDHPNGTKIMAYVGDWGTYVKRVVEYSPADGVYVESIYDDGGNIQDGCSIEMVIGDIDKDGFFELILVEDYERINSVAYVFRVKPNPYKDDILKYIGAIEGQSRYRILDNGHIVSEFGSQGLFSEYEISKYDTIAEII